MDLLDIFIPEETGCTLSLPDPDILTYYEQLDERFLWVDSEIDEGLLVATKKIILWNIRDKDIAVEDRIPIKVCIFSPGGSLAETMHACSVMQMSKTPICTVNMGMALSGGFLLLTAGHEGLRYTLPYSRAMLHSGSGSVMGDYEKAKDAMDDYKAQIEDMRNFIVEHTNISKQQLSKKRDRDWFMSADEQVAYGVVDRVVADIGEII